MLPQELALDRAWARAIAAAGILTDDEGQRIVAALDEIEARAKSDAAWLDASQAEDVHHFAESALIEKLGPLGAKLHTGRSRNEMVATEFRMYVKDAVRELHLLLHALLRPELRLGTVLWLGPRLRLGLRWMVVKHLFGDDHAARPGSGLPFNWYTYASSSATAAYSLSGIGRFTSTSL